MDAMVSIHLFGAPRIVPRDGEAVQLRRRPRLLLYYLAAHTEPLSRERCMSLLWPDDDADTARQLLRTALHQIKVACGDIIASDNYQVRLRESVWVDTRIIGALNAGDTALDEWLQNPPGDFLADLDTGDVEAVARWLFGERTRWQRRLADLFYQHAKFYVNQNQYSHAQHIIRVAHAYEPLREDIVQLAMELAYRCADRAGAISIYEQLQRNLDDQLGVPPMPTTTALYHDIVTDTYHVDEAKPRATIASEPFVGRQAELITCHGVGWDGRIILITGGAGIGKTRLASEYLRRSNALIIHAAAFDGDQHVPYHVLTTAMRAIIQSPAHHALRSAAVLATVWQRELRRLWPELPGGEPDQLALDNGENRLPEAIALLMHYLGQNRRLVLFLDDAQWLDDASLHAIAEVLRRKLDIQWQIVITIRPGELRPGMQRIVNYASRTQQLTRITLDPLNHSESQQLAQLIDPHYNHDTVARAEGNPFMVIELLRQGLNTAYHIPDAIRDLVATRINHTTPLARRFIESAAICGREFVVAQCAYLAELSDAQIPLVVDELQQHGLIRMIDAFRARFDHPLTVEGIVAQLGTARTHTLHLRFADMLISQTPHDHAHIAHHYHLAGADTQAVPHALAAARHAHQLGAWHEATHYMHIAIAGSDTTQRASMWLELGEMLSWGGDWKAAADAFQQAIRCDESVDGETTDMAQLGLAKTYLPQARYDTIIGIAETLIDHPTPRIATEAAFVCGTAYSLAGEQLDVAWQYLTRAEQYCRTHAYHDFLPRILFEQGSILAQQGEIDTAISRYRAALLAAEQVPAHHGRTWQILAHNNLAYHLHLVGQYAEAERHVRSGLRLAQRAGMRISQSYLYSTSGEIALAQGDIDGAERAFFEGLDIAERFGLPERVAGLHANLGLVARAREDIALAITQLSTAMHEADALGTHHLAAQIRIWLASISAPVQARTLLQQAEVLARNGGRQYLIRQIMALQQALPTPPSA